MFVGRGVVQISAYVDTVLASLLPTGAVAGLSYAQVLYTLPVSLFGMSVSAAELPAMASAVGSEAERAGLPARSGSARACGRSRSSSCPRRWRSWRSATWLPGALYQSGAFTRAMTVYVWGILAGSAVGLLASTMGRLYASTYYALHDTRTPLRFAVLRVGLTIGLGYLFALPLPRRARASTPAGARPGLTASAGMAGWVGVRPAPASPQPPDRVDRACRLSVVARLWARRGGRGRGAWALRAGPAARITRSCRAALLACTDVVYFFADRPVSGCPRPAALIRRLRRGNRADGATG